MVDHNDSLNSTVTNSFVDSTYETNESQDDSITALKVTEQSKQLPSTTCQMEENETLADTHSEEMKKDFDDSEITCTAHCTEKDTSESLRCNMCMKCYHTKCVGIKNINEVGAWTCACCRRLPQKISLIELQVKNIFENTSKILQTLSTYSENIENNFANLNDRITAISNQNKCAEQSNTSTLSDIQRDINNLKSDVDRKTGFLLSKSQGIFDKVKMTTEIIANINDTKSKKLENKRTAKRRGTETESSATDCHKSDNEESVILIDNESCQSNHNDISTPKNNKPSKQTPKRELTFIVGSGTLRGIETRFLCENVSVKSFNNVSIDSLKEKLSNMDLSRYKNVVLHIGKHDIDTTVDPESFKTKYASLLMSLSDKGCNVIVSGLLLRGG